MTHTGLLIRDLTLQDIENALRENFLSQQEKYVISCLYVEGLGLPAVRNRLKSKTRGKGRAVTITRIQQIKNQALAKIMEAKHGR